MSNMTPPKILKGFAIAAAGTLTVYIFAKSARDERKRKRYEQEKLAERKPGHSYQKIAEVESHKDGAANPSSEEVNDPSYGRKRR